MTNEFCPYTSPITVATIENPSLEWYCGVNCNNKCNLKSEADYRLCRNFMKAELESRPVSLVVNL